MDDSMDRSAVLPVCCNRLYRHVGKSCMQHCACSTLCNKQNITQQVPVFYRNDNVCREMSNVSAHIIIGCYAACEKASTMKVDKNGQALSSWLCVVGLVDAYGDQIAVWSWDGLVCNAFHWDLGLEVPAFTCLDLVL